MQTRVYRIVLWAASLAVGIGTLVLNAGDLNDPGVIAALVMSIITFVVTAVRQIGDDSTPTRPVSG